MSEATQPKHLGDQKADHQNYIDTYKLFINESIKKDDTKSLLQTQPASIDVQDERRRAAESFDLLVESRQQEIFE